jgi:hypothetical protein
MYSRKLVNTTSRSQLDIDNYGQLREDMGNFIGLNCSALRADLSRATRDNCRKECPTLLK